MFAIPKELEADAEFQRLLKAEIAALNLAEAKRADEQMVAAARHLHNHRPRGSETLGEMQMAMPTLALAHFKREERYDSGSREDRATLARLFPAMRVKSTRSKIGIGWEPEAAPEPVNVKFHKSYG